MSSSPDDERHSRLLRLLADASRLLASSFNDEATIGHVARLLVPTLADSCVIELFHPDGHIQTLGLAHSDPEREALLRELRTRYPLNAARMLPDLQPLLTGKAVLRPAVPDELFSAFVEDARHLELLQTLRLTSHIAVPLLHQGRVLGALGLGASDTRPAYTPVDLQVAEDIGAIVSIALANSQRYEAERLAATAAAARAEQETQARAQLESTLAQLEAVYQSAPVGLGFIDSELCHVRVSERMAEINGLPVAAHVGRSISEVLPELADTLIPIYEQILTTGEPVLNLEVSGETQAQPGVSRNWLVSYYPVRTASGTIAGVNVVVVEITERKRAEEALSASLERERASRGAAETALARVRRLQHLTALLAGALSTGEVAAIVADLGTASVGAHGAYLAQLVDGGDSLELLLTVREDNATAAVEQDWRRFPLSTALPVTDAIRQVRTLAFSPRAALVATYPELAAQPYAAGDEAWVATPLLASGTALGALFFSFGAPQPFTSDDLAFIEALAGQCALALERARLYTTEQAARAAAEAAATMREQFLTIASHELRTPLTGVKGFAQSLLLRDRREGHLQERDRQTLGRLLGQADRMEWLVDQLLDLRRIEHGQLHLEWGELDLAALLGQVTAELQSLAPKHELVVSDGGELWLAGDALRLEQVFRNIIGNAIKYSPQGGVVTVSLAGDATQVIVRVRDPGIGVPAQDIAHLFQRFFRASNVSSDTISGVGIGLYVAHEIVALHGGRIELESVEHAGATVSVTLPRSCGRQGAS